MLSSSNHPSVAENRYTDVWEDTESDSCGSPLPGVMSFSRRPTTEFGRPKGGISAISKLVAAQRKQVAQNAKPSLVTALLKPSPIVEPLVSPTTTNDPIIFPTNRPGGTRVSWGLESLRNFQVLGTSTVPNVPVSSAPQVAGASPADSTEPCEEDVLSPSTPPASLVVECFDPEEYQYGQKYRPSIPDHQHQWHPIREVQPVYYAFPAYCPQEQQLQELLISASPLFNNSPITPREECFHTRSDNAIAGISPEADTGVSTEAVTIPGTAPDTLPPPLLRSPPLQASPIMSWIADPNADPDAYYPDPATYLDPDQIITPSPPAATSPKTASSASLSYCTRCVIPLTFAISTSCLDQDEGWECCNCAGKNLK
ncbi:hypothetical protein SMACR_01220 [Sordaria macrospora]|uniref:WGS project CABT00000000 data, contig 2.4 n=2 Tax=Sordaria macrospora TaxID=5147 RepID=F7VQ71_SORMK|nr:uncharacterized protein SMAC_01220 [Sordaria macrospora k-hell]KAA8630392.1 hypothetical protein SMACR_01220 [Sordaria macrospora]KAH7634296.1 hypothetical protein B0T09DRAFT_369741 [Sordaria sp. MPI-SDFR-AT-0083]WPJ58903.1 hypothetical protein SMAC4_01220 [Sordaria macrospora]CCC07653.1 unnamed protein product [Sordaria macrospora k-hell]